MVSVDHRSEVSVRALEQLTRLVRAAPAPRHHDRGLHPAVRLAQEERRARAGDLSELHDEALAAVDELAQALEESAAPMALLALGDVFEQEGAWVHAGLLYGYWRPR